MQHFFFRHISLWVLRG